MNDNARFPPLTVLIVHGACGSAEGNWFPWLKRELEAAGIPALTPTFPTPEGQDFKAWETIAQRALQGTPPSRTMLVGHSVGATFALRLAEATNDPFHATFAVCPFAEKLNLPEFDALNESFVRHAFAWDRMKRGARTFALYAGDNDPYVPLKYAQEIADRLSTPLRVIAGGGHLNAEFGYTHFEPLLADILEQAGP